MDVGALRSRAESGDAIAQAIVGICYLDGLEVEVNYGDAFRFLSAAAARGLPRAIVNLARMYADGLGTAKDTAKAIQLYDKAASAGEFLAQVALGRIYSRGLGVPIDVPTALRWYVAALAQSERVDESELLEEARTYVASNSR
jgi:TPR repeat protein